MENFEEYQIWCFTKHIFFYAYNNESPAGFCKIVQWVGNKQNKGKVDFPIETAVSKINELYKQVYFKNNQLTA